MCGIFGLIVKPKANLQPESIESCFRKIAQISESRGKDSSGFAFRIDDTKSIHIIKGDVAVRKLLNSKEFTYSLNRSLESYQRQNGFFAFGHARLVTNGSQLHEENNQPVIKDGIITIHNGIIVNGNELWEKHPSIKRKYLIDTEIVPSLLRQAIIKNSDLKSSSKMVLKQLIGTYSVATMYEDLDQLILATNNGSLFFMTDYKSYLLFASEEHFIKKLRNQYFFNKFSNNNTIKQISPHTGLIINLRDIKIDVFKINDDNDEPLLPVMSRHSFNIQKFIVKNEYNKKEVIIEPINLIDRDEQTLKNLLELNNNAILNFQRCSKCILPETFPFIEFDDKGVCNYCRNSKKKEQLKSFDELYSLVKPYRSKTGKPDCIIPFSGGRDSTFVLHTVKKELGLNPIAFTYDWGMVTDLARRNIARVCGKLGVENIIVSADIHWKRQNIAKNLKAWIRQPNLGMIPLFMAGDKYFFYYTAQLKKQTGIKLNIWGINHLENTDFKVGFCGVKPDFNKKRIYSLSTGSQFNLFSHVAKNIFSNSAYLNASVIDTLGSFASRYLARKKDYFHFFDYYPWNEKEIEDLIIKEYNWEKAIDTNSTWRIGDGTAGFYNYIYYTVAGFSEYDTFRSNQIREGMITREEALIKVYEENVPRFESIIWYSKILGLDFKEIITRINSIPKLYKTT